MNNFNPHIPTHACLVDDAINYGAESALLLYHIKYILQRNEHAEQHLFDDIYWYRIEKEELLRQFPYFKNRQKIERLLANLVKNGILMCKNHNENQSDQTKWYGLHTAETLNAQNRALQCSDVGIGNEYINAELDPLNSAKPAENLNAQNRAMQCPEVSDAMPTSGHSHICNIESIDRVESARVRDNNNGFGLKEFVERFNQIPNSSNKVELADETKIFRWPNKVKAILDKSTRDEVEAVFAKIENNHYLLGQSASNKGIFWALNIGWLTMPDNWEKIADDGFAKHDKQKDKPEAKASPALDYTRLWKQYQTFKSAPPVVKAINKFIEDSRFAQMIIDDGGHDKLCHHLSNYLRLLVKDGAPIDIHQIEYKLLAPFREYRKPKVKTGGDV